MGGVSFYYIIFSISGDKVTSNPLINLELCKKFLTMASDTNTIVDISQISNVVSMSISNQLHMVGNITLIEKLAR